MRFSRTRADLGQRRFDGEDITRSRSASGIGSGISPDFGFTAPDRARDVVHLLGLKGVDAPGGVSSSPTSS
jgi:hypothetical protein